jgi:hypothetical protein
LSAKRFSAPTRRESSVSQLELWTAPSAGGACLNPFNDGLQFRDQSCGAILDAAEVSERADVCIDVVKRLGVEDDVGKAELFEALDVLLHAGYGQGCNDEVGLQCLQSLHVDVEVRAELRQVSYMLIRVVGVVVHADYALDQAECKEQFGVAGADRNDALFAQRLSLLGSR